MKPRGLVRGDNRIVIVLLHPRVFSQHPIHCQQQTEHTARFGAFPMERDEFLDALTEALCHETERGSWAGS